MFCFVLLLLRVRVSPPHLAENVPEFRKLANRATNRANLIQAKSSQSPSIKPVNLKFYFKLVQLAFLILDVLDVT